MRTLALLLSLIAIPVVAQEAAVAEILARAEAECASFENGEFDAGDAVAEIDLDGDGANDRLVDESRFSCSSAASLFCGSGGCMLHAVVGEEVASFQATGWRVIDWDGMPILLIGRDGGWCGGAGAQVCFEAVNWSMGDMLTVMPPVE
ncbi:MAG: hypothetical protein AAFU80_01350 [Pseudomonadota bacterium]